MKRTLIFSILVISIFLFSFGQSAQAEIKQVVLRVDGLACPFCAYGLEKKITKLKGVKSFEVNMKEGKVFVNLESNVEILVDDFYQAVKEAGFTLRSIFLTVQGYIEESKSGFVLITESTKQKFLLYQNKELLKKYHKGDISEAVSQKLKDKLQKIEKENKEVIIKGKVTRHKELPYSLSITELKVIE